MGKHIAGLGYDLPSNEAELFQLDKYPILDTHDGLEKSGDEEVLRQVLRMAFEDLIPAEIKLMSEAHEMEDWEKVQAIAHKIKGGSLYCGTIRMTYACQYLERYWKAGHRRLLEQLYQQLVTVLGETFLEIKSWLNR